MKLEVDYERKTLTVNGIDLSFDVLETIAKEPSREHEPYVWPWWRVTRIEGGIVHVEQASSSVLLEQWLMDGKGL